MIARAFLAGLLLLAGSLAACAGRGDAAQIRAVIEKANLEQQDAFAARDPSIMQDTSTARNYVFMAQINEELAAAGAIGVRLVNLEWGSVTVTSDGTAEAITWETWEITVDDGRSLVGREENAYDLIKIESSWKIDRVSHPARLTPSAGPAPAKP